MNSYKLELPVGYDISPTFSVNDLRPYIEDESNILEDKSKSSMSKIDIGGWF